MGVATEVITFDDMVVDFLGRTRQSDTTSTRNVAKRFINTALLDIHTNPQHKAPWAERRGVLITHAPYTTGTIDIDVDTDRTAVTGTDTLWTTTNTFGIANARAGGKFQPAGSNEIYEVSVVGGAGSITLATQYTGDDLDDATYVYFEDEYSLASDFGGFVDLRMFSTDMNIPLIGAMEFRRRYPRNNLRAKPKVACHIQLPFSGDTDAQHRVVLYPVPNDEYSIPYWYRTTNLAVTTAGAEQARLVNDSDEPIAPRKVRPALVLHAAYHYYRDYKDDATRSQEAKAEYVDLITRISGETKIGDDKPRFYVPSRGRRYRRGRFDSGNRFDEIRDR